jgi:DNA-binding NtrC family response regulator
MYNKTITRLDPEVMTSLVAYSWPGNIRELKNIIERMVILTDGEVITPEYIPAVITSHQAKPESLAHNLTVVTEQTERALIVETLKLAKDNRAKTAKLLGIPRSTLYYKMRQLGITS